MVSDGSFKEQILIIPRISYFKDFIYLFLERWVGSEKETERNVNVWLPLTHPLLGTWPTTQAHDLTGNQTSDLSVHRPALNPLSHTSQGFPILNSNVTRPKSMCPVRQKAKTQNAGFWSKEIFTDQEAANQEDGSPSATLNLS